MDATNVQDNGGYYVRNDSVTLDGITIKNGIARNGITPASVSTAEPNGILLDEGQNYKIQNMEIANFRGHGIYNPSTNVLIEDCYIHDWSSQATISGYGMQSYPAPVGGTIRRNRVDNWQHGILVAGSNFEVYNNIVSGADSDGLLIRYGATGADLYFNTLYGNGGVGLYIRNDTSGTTARNNIAYANGVANITDDASSTLSNNFTSNPLFVSAGTGNFHLTEASPARSIGVAVSGITTDFDGRTLTDPPDIGALQWGVGAVDPPPDDEDGDEEEEEEEEEESPPVSSPGGGGGGGGITEPVDEEVFPQLTNVIDSFDTVRFDNEIHADTQERVTGRVAYHQFNMATEQWETVNQLILASNSHGDTGCTICVRTDGEPVVVFMGDRVAKSALTFDGMTIAGAGNYQRAYLSRLVSGSWTSPVMVGSPDDLEGTFYPEGLNFGGNVHVRVGRAIAEADNWVRLVFTVDVPGDVANTPELYTQRLRPDNTLTATEKVKLALSTWYTTVHVVGQPCVFEHEGTAYTAVPVGFTHHPMLFIWDGAGTAGGATMQIELVDETTAVQVQPDSFCTLNPPISVHYFKEKLHVVMGTRKAGTTEWTAYKTISPPFTTLDPNPLSEPRNDQAGVTWPNGNYARQGVEFATIAGRDYLFKVATGNTGVPNSTKKSILEKIDIDADIPGDNAYTVAQFLIDNA